MELLPSAFVAAVRCSAPRGCPNPWAAAETSAPGSGTVVSGRLGWFCVHSQSVSLNSTGKQLSCFWSRFAREILELCYTVLCQGYCLWHELAQNTRPWVTAAWVCEKLAHGENASRWCSRTCTRQDVEVVEKQKTRLSCPSSSACFPGKLSLPVTMFPWDSAESDGLCCNCPLAKLPAGLAIMGLELCSICLGDDPLHRSRCKEDSCRATSNVLPDSWQLLLCPKNFCLVGKSLEACLFWVVLVFWWFCCCCLVCFGFFLEQWKISWAYRGVSQNGIANKTGFVGLLAYQQPESAQVLGCFLFLQVFEVRSLSLSCCRLCTKDQNL